MTNESNQPGALVGIEERDTRSGIHVFRVHYTADPMKRDDEALDELAAGMLGGRLGRAWRREMEIDWTVASGIGIYIDDFVRDVHVSKKPLAPLPGFEIQRGYDFGLQPAVVWCQLVADGVLLVLRELVTWNGRGPQVTHDAEWLGEMTEALSARFYPGFEFEDYCDPAGWQRAQTDSRTCVEELNKHTIYPTAGPVTFEDRRTAVGRALRTMKRGVPAILIDPSCHMIIEGFEGAYKFKQAGEDDGATLMYKADKNPHSHIMNGLEYVVGSVFTALPSRALSSEEEDEDNYTSPSRNMAGGIY